jgi:hypothetical protein
LHARVDQAGAELRQIQNAGDQRDQAGKIENDDAAGEARNALRKQKLPDRLDTPACSASAVCALISVVRSST